MNNAPENKRFVVDIKNLPPLFPTHRHSSMFWESLGRTVATFGFLEEVLGKAIFAFSATTPHPERLKQRLKNGCRHLREL
jgi:hypothetical protein